MSTRTQIHHPDLKTTVTVDERAVPVWEASGWKQGPRPDEQSSHDDALDEAPAPPDEPPTDSATKVARASKPKTPAAPPATPDA